MNTETVIARKVIKDHMLSNKLDASTIEVDKSLLKTAGSASRKCSQVPADKQNEKKNANEVQKEIIIADMEKLKSRCVQMSQTIDPLEKEFLECIEMSEKNNDMTFVIKGNCLKRKTVEIK